MNEFDLVRIEEIKEHRHEDPRVWKSKEWYQFQDIFDSIRKKEVFMIYNTPEK